MRVGPTPSRAQSHVVGVALMLGLAVVALGSLTVGVGTFVDSQAASADAQRMADGLDRAVQGTERTGFHSHSVSFSDGTLRTTDRTLRVLENNSIIQSYEIEALVYENDEFRITAVAGAVLRDSGHSSSLVSGPSVTSSRRNGVLVVGVPRLNASHTSVGGQGTITNSIETNVSHERFALGTGEYAVAIETATPAPFERYFEERDGTTRRRSFGGDEHESVVVTFPTNRQGYVVVHDLNLEVTNG
ncbi:MAG: type IV pilin [Halovenus sp.]|uniref:DUF7289 family protein n=1 Tax=Halovenus amylolytica TaxID=2500550 RepID=UPI000FE31D27